MKLYIVKENLQLHDLNGVAATQAGRLPRESETKKKWHWLKGKTAAIVKKMRFVALDINYEHLS